MSAEEPITVDGEQYVLESRLDEAQERIIALELELRQKDGVIKNLTSNAASQQQAIAVRMRKLEQREAALKVPQDERTRKRISKLEESRDFYMQRCAEARRMLIELEETIRSMLAELR